MPRRDQPETREEINIRKRRSEAKRLEYKVPFDLERALETRKNLERQRRSRLVPTSGTKILRVAGRATLKRLVS